MASMCMIMNLNLRSNLSSLNYTNYHIWSLGSTYLSNTNSLLKKIKEVFHEVIRISYRIFIPLICGTI